MKKTNKKQTKAASEPKPEDFATQAEAEAATEEYITSQPIYNYFQFFIGGPNNVAKNKQQGKPGTPPY